MAKQRDGIIYRLNRREVSWLEENAAALIR